MLACLGHASRFRLVCTLAEYERCVGELADAVGLSQSCTTRHLQALERLGLVEGHREGRRVRFRLSARAPELEEILGWVLSGTGITTFLAGADLHRDAADLAPQEPRPGSAKRGPSQPGGRAHGEMAPRHQGPRRQPTTSQEAVGGHPGGQGAGDLGTAGVWPARRDGDLEDYLL